MTEEFEFGSSVPQSEQILCPEDRYTWNGRETHGTTVGKPTRFGGPSRRGLAERRYTPICRGLFAPAGAEVLQSDEKIPFRDLRKPFTIRGLTGFDSIDE